ncbi:MAG: hypothetical protein ABSF23_11310 [Terracidiphilus sp.]|jgi:hypothetical protein
MTRSSIWNSVFGAVGLAACLALAAGLTGCRVHVDKGANGEDKHVQIDMPFGGIHVNTDQTTAADLGLPVYPGAQAVKGDDNHKSADVHMGFGEWELRVKVVSYMAPDSQDKVTAFYKKALTRYGDVIACQDHKPVGTPAATSEGLTCADDGGANVKVDDGGHGYQSNDSGFQLKAGSKRHQHMVKFESSAPGQTRFALVALDLPAEVEGKSSTSD